MRGLIRLGLWWWCAEWLLIFRVGMAPRMVGYLIGLGALRLIVHLSLLPMWDFQAMGLIAAVLGGCFFQIVQLCSRQTRARREVYDIPDMGGSWLVLIWKQPHVTVWVMEPFVAGAIVMYGLVHMTATADMTIPSLVMTDIFGATGYEWERQIANDPEGVAALVALSSVVALMIHNWTTPVRKTREVPSSMPAPPERKPLPYSPVRQHRHAVPSLPSVRQLAQGLTQDTRAALTTSSKRRRAR